MKLKIGFLLFLCLNFRVWGQDKNRLGEIRGALAAQTIPRIGQPVPDVLVTEVKGYGTKHALRLSEFKDKLLILDFWATWCAPCRKMVPVMDSLQKVFGDRVVFLPVTYQSAAEVAPVLAAMQRIRTFSLPEVTGDKVLHAMFPHNSLPHYVWIDRTGVLRAVTEDKEVTGENIRKMLADNPAGRVAALREKRDTTVAYDPLLPLLIDGNGGKGEAFRYHSLLTGYLPGLSGGLNITPYDTLRGQLFTARNTTFVWLCKLAFGEGGRVFPEGRVSVESRDSLRLDTRLSGEDYVQWLCRFGWCYELALPPGRTDRGFRLMQEDLRRQFPQYLVRVEKRVMDCLALVRTADADHLRSAGGKLSVEIGPYSAKLRNAHLSQLMMRLERQYLYASKLPVVDLSAYTGRVDMDLEAKLYDVPSLNTALQRYGLALLPRKAVVEVLVIADAPLK